MAGLSMCSNTTVGAVGNADVAFIASKDQAKEQALVILVVQQLADVQFARADEGAAERLWREVGALHLPLDRVNHLLYCGLDCSDREALRAEDNAWLARRQGSRPPRWWRRGWRPGWARHQTRPAVCAV